MARPMLTMGTMALGLGELHRARSPDPWRIATLTLAVALGLLLLGYWLWSQRAEQRAIATLSDERREIAYRAAMQTLDQLCVHDVPGELDEYCERQAAFVVEFPECDDHCRELSKQLLTRRVPAR